MNIIFGIWRVFLDYPVEDFSPKPKKTTTEEKDKLTRKYPTAGTPITMNHGTSLPMRIDKAAGIGAILMRYTLIHSHAHDLLTKTHKSVVPCNNQLCGVCVLVGSSNSAY